VGQATTCGHLERSEERRNKLKKLLVIMLALIALMAMAVPAMAISPSEQACIDSDGTWVKDGGNVSCTHETSDPVGNSESSGGKSQTRDTSSSDSSNGTLNNDPQFEEEDSCTGPGNSKNC